MPLRTPASVLEAESASVDPSRRAPALAWIVRARPADALPRWVMQGTYDPEPWVQQGVVASLLARVDEPAVLDALVDYVQRGSGDPYVRAHAAHQLIDLGHADRLGGLVGAWAGQPPWRAAPLALVSARLGDEGARLPLELLMSRADVRDDTSFVVDLATYGWPTLSEALARGLQWHEPESALRFQVARAVLGARDARDALRQALRSTEPGEARDVLDLIRALPPEPRATWAAFARGARDPSVRAAAALVRRPTAAGLVRGVHRGDPYVGEVAIDLSDALGIGQAEVARAAIATDDAVLRAHGAALAGHARVEALIPDLLALAGDDYADVRVAAYGALLVMGVTPPAP
ncbi:MAG: hypothetical protein H6733_13425 [Alphaproteobacteria bacterium]|nr:hypothetical protein [Alphaproteobacteria bacterium]